MDGRRSYAARFGLALLNLPAAGLGLLRLGKWRSALAIYLVSTGGLWLISNGPLASFPILASVALTALLSVLLSIVLTWICSAQKLPVPIYGRWFSLLAILLTSYLAAFMIFPDVENRHYRSFYLPSEAMMPTLPKQDRFFGYMQAPDYLHRGDLVLVRRPDGIVYVKRIAALPGDRFSMHSGSIILNGSLVPQKLIDQKANAGSEGKEPVRTLREQFPGETGSHEILDLGQGPLDDFPEVVIAPGRVFVLGDNRDRSADSRGSPAEDGLGSVALGDIVGVPLYYSWGSSRPLGTKIH